MRDDPWSTVRWSPGLCGEDDELKDSERMILLTKEEDEQLSTDNEDIVYARCSLRKLI